MKKKKLARSTAKAETTDRRGMVWSVYEYEVRYEEQRGKDGSFSRLPYLVAPGLAFDFKPLYDEDGQRVIDKEGRPASTFRDIDFGVARQYAPLQHPDILLKLVALGDLFARPEKMDKLGTHPLTEMLAFAHEFGLLGVSDSSGARESLQEFAVAAGRLARMLRLYEAATAGDEKEGNVDALRRLYRNTHSAPELNYVRPVKKLALHDLREAALDEVQVRLYEELRARSFRVQYRLRAGSRTGPTKGFDRGDGFTDLYGACWLLLDYLMRDPDERRCKREGCNKVIDFAAPDTSDESDASAPKINPKTGKPYERGPYRTRADKEFCSKACYRNWRYHNIEKLTRQAARP